ncbi:MAG: GspH/FimT family pseudopilin [Planctomycetes bacterium]|nr:GspH/FimT family pseudopilin [Planctomycetota bacterium]
MQASPTSRRRGSASRAARGAGFTLVELLVVIIGLGLIVTVVAINWRAIVPRAELHSAVRDLAGALQSTRSEAIARNASYEVQYDLDGQRYRIVTPFRAPTEAGVGGLATVSEERLALSWKRLPESVRFDNIWLGTEVYSKGLVSVTFDALGSASGHVVVLQQPLDQNTYTIEVQGLLGLISFHEGLFERAVPREDDFL